MEIHRLGRDGVDLVAGIDRSEHVSAEYELRNGSIVERPVSMTDIPAWDAAGDGPHSLVEVIAFCRRVVDDGGVVVAAYEGEEVAGIAVVHGDFEPGLAWLAFLHVSRPHRRAGVATALWAEAAAIAAEAGAEALYVSAVPTGSAVGFYLGRGCRPADPVHPDLFSAEPDDIHLVCRL